MAGVARRRGARLLTLPAPVAGWNTKDPLAAMKPEFATILDNFFPAVGAVRLRGGSASYATGCGTGSVESLMPWNGPASAKLFAASGTAIYDVSAAGATGAAVVSSLTNARWYSTMFGAGGGTYLVAANGADAVRNYDGTTWTSPAITGVTSANLIAPWAFKSRLFFAEKNTANAWYLPTLSIAGAAQKLDFSTLFTKGGYLVAGAALSRDSYGGGMDDYCVFVSSRGQVLIYKGTDPSSASAWALAYRMDLGAPVGRKPFVQIGPELVLVSLDGYVPLSVLINNDRAEADRLAVSDNINPAVRDAAAAYKANFGWEGVLFPTQSMLLVNVPVAENSVAQQHVMNTVTGAWCRYTGLNANCWAVYNDKLYFGGQGGVVYQAETGTGDSGADVTGDMACAFSTLGAPGAQKLVTMMRPMLTTTATIAPAIDAQVDFADALPTNVPTYGATTGTPWGSPWGSKWSAGAQPQTSAFGAAGLGIYARPRMRVASKSATVSVNGFSLSYMVGGFL